MGYLVDGNLSSDGRKILPEGKCSRAFDAGNAAWDNAQFKRWFDAVSDGEFGIVFSQRNHRAGSDSCGVGIRWPGSAGNADLEKEVLHVSVPGRGFTDPASDFHCGKCVAEDAADHHGAHICDLHDRVLDDEKSILYSGRNRDRPFGCTSGFRHRNPSASVCGH